MNLHNNFLKSSALSNALFNKLFKSVNLKNKKRRNDDKQIFIQEQKRYIKNLIIYGPSINDIINDVSAPITILSVKYWNTLKPE